MGFHLLLLLLLLWLKCEIKCIYLRLASAILARTACPDIA